MAKETIFKKLDRAAKAFNKQAPTKRLPQKLEKISNIQQLEDKQAISPHEIKMALNIWQDIYSNSSRGEYSAFDVFSEAFVTGAIETITNAATPINLICKDLRTREPITEGVEFNFALKPCPNITYSEFIRESLINIIVWGRLSYLLEESPGFSSKKLTGLYITPASNSYPILNQSTNVRDQIKNPYKGFFINGVNMGLDEVLYTFRYTPRSGYLGEGILSSVFYDVSCAINGIRVVNNLTRNGNIAPFVTHFPQGTPKERIHQYEKEYKEKAIDPDSLRFPKIVTDGMTLQPMIVSNREIQLIEIIKANREAIAAGIGVSLDLLSGGNRTYENVYQSMRLLYKNKVVPMLGIIQDVINDYLIKINADYYYEFDYTTIPELKPDFTGFGNSIPNLLLAYDVEEVREFGPADVPREKPSMTKSKNNPIVERKEILSKIFNTEDNKDKESKDDKEIPLEDKFKHLNYVLETKPYPNESSCRFEYKEGQKCKRIDNDHEFAGKEVDALYCHVGDSKDWYLQAWRFRVEKGWKTDAEIAKARKHCEDNGGKFEEYRHEEEQNKYYTFMSTLSEFSTNQICYIIESYYKKIKENNKNVSYKVDPICGDIRKELSKLIYTIGGKFYKELDIEYNKNIDKDILNHTIELIKNKMLEEYDINKLELSLYFKQFIYNSLNELININIKHMLDLEKIDKCIKINKDNNSNIDSKDIKVDELETYYWR